MSEAVEGDSLQVDNQGREGWTQDGLGFLEKEREDDRVEPLQLREEASGQDLNFPTQPKALPTASSCLTCLGRRRSPGLEIGAWAII